MKRGLAPGGLIRKSRFDKALGCLLADLWYDFGMSNIQSAKPGERWLVNLQPVQNQPSNAVKEVSVTLNDFDPRTETWMVQVEGTEESVALLARHLIKRLS